MTPSDEVTVGLVARPHGVRGEVVVESRLDDPELFYGLRTVRLAPPTPGAAGTTRRVRSWRPLKDRMLLSLDGVNDRDAAEALRGQAVLVKASDLPPPSEDDIFLRDLLGCRVATSRIPDLGVIEDVSLPGGSELWIIRHPSGREILFPAAPEFVTEVDLEAKLVQVDPPPGLLELYGVAEDGPAEAGAPERADP